MSILRYAKRRDHSEPEIRKALEKAGFVVFDHLPVDLLCFRPDQCRDGFVRLLEIKTPTKTGKRRKRKDQEAQDAFVKLTGTPIALTAEDALRALGAM